jgi:TetR/AcrR family transcriptional regulator
MNANDAPTLLRLHGTRLFGLRGYGSTSVRELVEAAGVTKPTLYYHFGSKEGLFLALANELLRDLDTMVAAAIASSDDLPAQLERLLLDNVRFAAERPDAVRFLMTCLHQVDHGQPSIDLLSMDATFVRHLAGVFARAIERGDLRADIDLSVSVISFLGIVRTWAMAAFHGAPIPTDFERTVVRHFLYGIRDR